MVEKKKEVKEEEEEKEEEEMEEKEEEEQVSAAQHYAQTEHGCDVCVICQKKYLNDEICRVLQ